MHSAAEKFSSRTRRSLAASRQRLLLHVLLTFVAERVRAIHYNPLAASKDQRLDEIDSEFAGKADAVVLVGDQWKRPTEEVDVKEMTHFHWYRFG